jgi:threonine synthase
VTAGVTGKLIEQGLIRPEETTVVSITGNGLKTTDAIAADFPLSDAIPPKLEAFEELVARNLEEPAQIR